MKNFIGIGLLVFTVGLAFGQDKANKEMVKIESDQNYLVLSTKRIQTMEKELDEVSAKGFRVMYGAPTTNVEMGLFLTRLHDPEKESFAYKILATSRLKTMEKELNDLAVKGYRLLPRTIIFKQGFLTSELLMVVERDIKANRTYEYKLVNALKEVNLHKRIDEATALGFAPMTMITLGDHVVVMEREIRAVL